MHAFVRHPPVPDADGLCYGRLDLDVPSAVQRDAARALAAELPPWPIASSPSLRCRALADALRALRGDDRPVRVDARLREMDFGAWEGRAWASLPRADLDAWAADLDGFAPPGGESFVLLRTRVRDALDALAGPHVVVTHAGVIRAALALGGMPTALAASASIAHAQALWPLRAAKAGGR